MAMKSDVGRTHVFDPVAVTARVPARQATAAVVHTLVAEASRQAVDLPEPSPPPLVAAPPEADEPPEAGEDVVLTSDPEMARLIDVLTNNTLDHALVLSARAYFPVGSRGGLFVNVYEPDLSARAPDLVLLGGWELQRVYRDYFIRPEQKWVDETGQVQTIPAEITTLGTHSDRPEVADVISMLLDATAVYGIATAAMRAVGRRLIKSAVVRTPAEIQALGALREQQVARHVGGVVAHDYKLLIPSIKGRAVKVDVFGPRGEFIGVGGPGKGRHLDKTISYLTQLRRYADYYNTQAHAYFVRGTERKVLDAARRVLGDNNVHVIPDVVSRTPGGLHRLWQETAWTLAASRAVQPPTRGGSAGRQDSPPPTR